MTHEPVRNKDAWARLPDATSIREITPDMYLDELDEETAAEVRLLLRQEELSE